MRRLVRPFSTYSVFTILLIGLCWGPITHAQVRINEVDYTDMWVELYNAGTSSVDVSSYQLCTYPTYSSLSSLTGQSTVTMAAGEFLVVDWNPLSNTSGDPDGEVGLYVDGDSFTDHTDMVDYMEFGEAGHFRESVAIDAGEWESGEFVSLAPSGKTLSYFGSPGDVGEENWDASNETKGTANDPIPVELAVFGATTEGDDVRLVWQTASETNNAGFELQHRTGGSAFETRAFVDGHGTTSAPKHYEYLLRDLPPGPHVFRLRQVDLDGSSSLSHTVDVRISLASAAEVSIKGSVPTHSMTTVSLAVRTSQSVTLRLYDVLGRPVRTIYDGPISAGPPRQFRIDTSPLSSGRYFLRAWGTTFVSTKSLAVTH